MNLMNARRRQPLNVEHVEQPLGHRLAQLLQVARLARLYEIAHDGQRRGSEPANAGEIAGTIQWREIVGAEGEERLCRACVRATLERALPLELEIGRNLRQHVRVGP